MEDLLSWAFFGKYGLLILSPIGAYLTLSQSEEVRKTGKGTLSVENQVTYAGAYIIIFVYGIEINELWAFSYYGFIRFVPYFWLHKRVLKSVESYSKKEWKYICIILGICIGYIFTYNLKINTSWVQIDVSQVLYMIFGVYGGASAFFQGAKFFSSRSSRSVKGWLMFFYFLIAFFWVILSFQPGEAGRLRWEVIVPSIVSLTATSHMNLGWIYGKIAERIRSIS